MGQGKEMRNKVTTRNGEVGQTNTREEKLAGTSTEDAVWKSSQATFTLSTEEGVIHGGENEGDLMSGHNGLTSSTRAWWWSLPVYA
jgi:hypothetical protein